MYLKIFLTCQTDLWLKNVLLTNITSQVRMSSEVISKKDWFYSFQGSWTEIAPLDAVYVNAQIENRQIFFFTVITIYTTAIYFDYI